MYLNEQFGENLSQSIVAIQLLGEFWLFSSLLGANILFSRESSLEYASKLLFNCFVDTRFTSGQLPNFDKAILKDAASFHDPLSDHNVS